MNIHRSDTPTRVYWENLVRVRTWGFATVAPIVVCVVIMAIVPLSGWFLWSVYFALVILSVYISLHTQMSCRACGRILATSKVQGPISLCRACNTPTDAYLDGKIP